MTTRNVATAGEFASALTASIGGDVINLTANVSLGGNLTKAVTGGVLTITATSPNIALTTPRLENSSFIKFTNMALNLTGTFRITACTDMTIEKVNVLSTFLGMHGCQRLTFQYNQFSGMVQLDSRSGFQNDIKFICNLFKFVPKGDHLQVYNTRRLLIENNTFYDLFSDVDGTGYIHSDMIQFVNFSEDCIVRGNHFYDDWVTHGNHPYTPQGLIDGGSANLLIEDNFACSGSPQVFFTQGSGIIMRRNTVLPWPTDNQRGSGGAPETLGGGVRNHVNSVGAQFSNNLWKFFNDGGSDTILTNNSTYGYTTFEQQFNWATKGKHASDFVATPGGEADGKGAFARINAIAAGADYYAPNGTLQLSGQAPIAPPPPPAPSQNRIRDNRIMTISLTAG